MKQKGKVIASSIVAIAMSASLAVSGTFALFTSEHEVNIAVTSGTVDVEASVNAQSLKTYSMGAIQDAGKFQNGGTAAFNAQSQLELSLMTPGDKAEFTVDIANNSNVAIQYMVTFGVSGELAGALDCEATNLSDDWIYAEAGKAIDSVAVRVELPESVGNDYQSKGNTVVTVKVEAVQGNTQFEDQWDGTANIDWFLANPTADTYELSTAEDLAGLAALVDGGGAIPADVEADAEATIPEDFDGTFEGTTFTLNKDLDLTVTGENGESLCFNPIGSYRGDTAFKGTFDGQGHTISNLSQNTWALNNGYYYGDLGLGLFGLVENATIKNLKMDNANISGESAICGIVAACAYGDCTFENITVSNSKGADYQYYSGGIVGWASGNHQYINCNVEASTTIAAQWGDFDNSTGGVIGGCGGSAEILIKDCTVACAIDAYNDVTSSYQWYAYRRCGMLIGNTGKTVVDDKGTTYAAAPQLTCENVTVIYGEWANYTYCEFAGTSWPYVRVQAGVSNSAYSNPRYGHPTDANGNEVVDDNHVHNDGEDHQILCVFDQLYGGGQGVYGAPAHDGVEVIYNNK